MSFEGEHVFAIRVTGTRTTSSECAGTGTVD